MTRPAVLARSVPLAAALLAGPALAQHAGHEMPMPSGMADMPAAPEPQAGPKADAAKKPAPTPPATGESRPAMPPMAGHDMGAMDQGPAPPPEAPPPPEAFSGPPHAADLLFVPAAMARAREHLRAEQGDVRSYRVLVDRIEARFRDGRDGYFWDAKGWWGGDIHKLWIKTEGEGGFGGELDRAEVQALWSRAITPWFDVQAGARYDFEPHPTRSHLVLGLQGLAPYFFEIEAAAFLSEKGDLTARLEAEYDQLITQKLILQPRAEVELSARDIPELDIGAGVSAVEAALRLRYEVVPEFAPYVGVGYERKLGQTADFARDDGEDVSEWRLMVGLRAWF